MAKELRDTGASVRARLLNLARERGQVFDLLLTRYALERLLYRLSVSAHRDRFVLKGAMLVTSWFEDPHRPTRDLDLLGYGDASAEAMRSTWKDICGIEADDGITFDGEALSIGPIREDLEYGGLRLRTTATLARARISITVDIGFGDAVEPGVEDIDLPVLLDLPTPHLRAYPRETVVAEKFHAMATLGLTNSRMKDFYDVWVLSKTYKFDSDRLVRAIAATFARRGTEVPDTLPDAFTPEFFRNASKLQQWSAFVRDLSADIPSLEIVVSDLAAFLGPLAAEARRRKGDKPSS
ncbi:MAG: nucleotidyl transferase AbiEii/AbiGii toxin family protein [Gammaproteobacteria bacterium]|jgi:predicted nucleotidyltransferase component of viral defense system|nr:nucleotidyl transferase AbiEii/AbiGii toxin family protein [Gammaproteobacteria bacterium]